MRTLLHMPHDPASRMVRIVLSEKGLAVRLVETRPWEDDGALAAVNPACTVPVLVDETPSGDDVAISPASAIIEYLDEVYTTSSLLPSTSAARAETRRLCCWFNEKFERDVIGLTVREKIDKRLMRRGQADYELLKQGLAALAWHFDYFAWLLENRSWIAGERFSAADIAAAAHFSALDYIDAISWEKFPSIKDWYARLKSRPSMRQILQDRINGLPPPSHYDNLDF